MSSAIQINPYVNFNGKAGPALQFWAAALGGTIEGLMKFGDSPMPCGPEEKELVMHATFKVGGATIMVSDGRPAEPVPSISNIHISMNYLSVSEMEKAFAALSEGGTVVMPLAKQFWGATFGMLTDKFGIQWMFNCEAAKA